MATTNLLPVASPALDPGRARFWHISRGLSSVASPDLAPRPPGRRGMTWQAAAGDRVRERLRAGDCSDIFPRLGVVGDRGEPPTQFNGVRQLALLREKDANRTSIRFLDEEHFWQDGDTRQRKAGRPIARYRRLGPLAPPQSSRSVKLAMRETRSPPPRGNQPAGVTHGLRWAVTHSFRFVLARNARIARCETGCVAAEAWCLSQLLRSPHDFLYCSSDSLC